MQVTVVIPTYNRADLLPDALDSVFRQDYENIEVVVVDDASTDDTAEVVEAASGDIVYIRHGNNRGVGAARNTGIEAARGQLVAFLDSDDLWLSQKVSSQVELFLQNQDVGIVGGGCRYETLSGQIVGAPEIPQKAIPLEKMAISVSLPGVGSNVMIPKSVLNEVGGFPTDMTRAEDYHLMLRIALRYPVVAVPDVLTVVRVHDTPRPGVNIEKTIECRKKVQRLLEDPKLQRKNGAWWRFLLGRRCIEAGKPFQGVWLLIMSFIQYPLALSESHRRLRPLIAVMVQRVFGK